MSMLPPSRPCRSTSSSALRFSESAEEPSFETDKCSPRPYIQFTHFSRLPPEIQLQVWQHFHNLSPVIVYKYIPYTPEQYQFEYSFTSRDTPQLFLEPMKKVPPILHVCQQSRIEGLKHYSLGFNVSAVKDGKYEGSNSMPRGVFWNKVKDIMWLQSPCHYTLQAREADYVLQVLDQYDHDLKRGTRWGTVKFDTFFEIGRNLFPALLGTNVLFIFLHKDLRRSIIDDESKSKVGLAVMRCFWRKLLRFGYQVEMDQLRVRVVFNPADALEVVEIGRVPPTKCFEREELYHKQYEEDEALWKLSQGRVSNLTIHTLGLGSVAMKRWEGLHLDGD